MFVSKTMQLSTGRAIINWIVNLGPKSNPGSLNAYKISSDLWQSIALLYDDNYTYGSPLDNLSRLEQLQFVPVWIYRTAHYISEMLATAAKTNVKYRQ